MISHLWQGLIYFVVALGWLCLISFTSAILFVLFGKLGVRINDRNESKTVGNGPDVGPDDSTVVHHDFLGPDNGEGN